jgi:hypothetical protein
VRQDVPVEAWNCREKGEVRLRGIDHGSNERAGGQHPGAESGGNGHGSAEEDRTYHKGGEEDLAAAGGSHGGRGSGTGRTDSDARYSNAGAGCPAEQCGS